MKKLCKQLLIFVHFICRWNPHSHNSLKKKNRFLELYTYCFFRTKNIKCGRHSPQVSFTLNEELTVIEGIEDKTVSAPREHPFTMQSVGGQTLAVFTETSSGEF